MASQIRNHTKDNQDHDIFYQARQEQQKDMISYLYELKECVDLEKETSDVWRALLQSVRMRTLLTPNDRKLLLSVFTTIASSPKKKQYIHEFMTQLRESTLEHPYRTKHFLQQIFPVRDFPRSIHKYTQLPIIGTVLEYIHSFVSPPSTKQFQQQLVQYLGSSMKTLSLAHCIQKKNQQHIKQLLTPPPLPSPIRKDVQQFLKRKDKNSQQQQQFHDAVSELQQQKQQQEQQRQIINKINKVVYSQEQNEAQKISTIAYLIDRLKKLKMDGIDVRHDVMKTNLLALRHMHPNLTFNEDDESQLASIESVIQLVGPGFQKIPSSYRQQTKKILKQQQQQHKNTPMSMRALFVVALLGLGNDLSEKDFINIFRQLKRLLNSDDPYSGSLFQRTRSVFLQKLETSMKDKNIDTNTYPTLIPKTNEIFDYLETNFRRNTSLSKIGFYIYTYYYQTILLLLEILDWKFIIQKVAQLKKKYLLF